MVLHIYWELGDHTLFVFLSSTYIHIKSVGKGVLFIQPEYRTREARSRWNQHMNATTHVKYPCRNVKMEDDQGLWQCMLR